jgi:type II secretory pathway component PulJ
VLADFGLIAGRRPPRALAAALMAPEGLQTIFFIFVAKRPILLAMTFKSLPFAPRKIRATEERLERIYEAASLGLKGDALALAAGLLPTEYRQLCELDPVASLAEMKGRADSEREAAAQLRDAARNGDAKAALSILQHTHGWVAKQAISVDVEQRISITAALEQAQKRVIDKVIDALDVTDLSDPSKLTDKSDNKLNANDHLLSAR